MSTVDRLRQRFEARMVDTIRITYASGVVADNPIDPATGKPLAQPDDTTADIYGPTIEPHRGKALIQPTAVNDAEPAATQVNIVRHDVMIPVSAPVPAPGAICTVVTSAHDPAAVGRTLTVVATTIETYGVARLVQAEAVSAARARHGE